LGLLSTLTVHAATSTAWQGGGADLNWSTDGNWTNAAPTPTTDVYFTGVGTTNSPAKPNNIVAADRVIQSLSLVNETASTYHTTLINPGVTLTVSNNAGSGNVVIGGDFVAAAKVITNYFQGAGGTLQIVATNMAMTVHQQVSSGSKNYAVDMSGLDNFTAYMTRIYVAGDSGLRPRGTLMLAKTNFLVLSGTSDLNLKVAHTTSSGSSGITESSLVSLGMTNGIFGDYGIGIGLYKSGVSALLNFNPVTAVGGTAYFRNRAGTGPQNYWLVGDGNAGAYSGNAAIGTIDFSLGTVDAQVGTLVVGRNQNTAGAGAEAGGATGTLTLKSGKLNVDTAMVGYQNTDNSAAAKGVVNVDGTAQVTITNSLQLGHFMGWITANSNSYAILNIGTNSGGGSVTVMGNITTTTNASNPGSYSEIHVRNGGSLTVKGTVGPLSTFELKGTPSASTMTFDFGLLPNPSGAVCVASNLQTVPPLTLNLRGNALGVGQFPLIQYQSLSGGGLSDFTTVNWPTGVQGYLSNNVANSSIDMVITNAPETFWNGLTNSVNIGNWDISLTPNWKHLDGTPTVYSQASVPGSAVNFDDSALGTTTVNLTTALSPAGMSFSNSAKAYSFTGGGQLSGPGGISKRGSGTLTVGNSGSNGFTGPITIHEGTLQLSGAANELPTGATVTLDDVAGATLDLNNNSQTLANISGGGATGGNVSLGSARLTLKAVSGTYGGIISGTGMLITTNSGTLALSGANQYSGGTLVISSASLRVNNPSGSGTGSGPVDVENGTFYIGTGGAAGSVAASSITNNGGTVYLYRSDDYTFPNVLYGTGTLYGLGTGRAIIEHPNYHSGQTTAGNGPIRISHANALGTGVVRVESGVAAARLELTNNITVANPLDLACKGGALLQPPHIVNVSDTNTLTGPITLNGGGSDWVFQSDAGKLVIHSTMSLSLGGTRNYWLFGDGDGEVYGGFPVGVYVSPFQPTNNLTKDGAGTWTLWGANTYNGTTTIKNGTLIMNGSLVAGASAGTSSTNVTVSGTLAGTGLIAAPVYIYAGGTLSPGASSGSIGTLTISNSLTFYSGTALFDVSAGGCDQVRGLSAVDFSGGTLKVQLNGTLSGNMVFKLFDAASYSVASFAGFDLPALTAPLTWDTSSLTVDGTLRVIGGPVIGSFGVAGDGNFQLSGTGATDQPYRILATTNVADPASWSQVDSGTFAGGLFSFKDLTSTNYPRRFYRVVTP